MYLFPTVMNRTVKNTGKYSVVSKAFNGFEKQSDFSCITLG